MKSMKIRVVKYKNKIKPYGLEISRNNKKYEKLSFETFNEPVIKKLYFQSERRAIQQVLIVEDYILSHDIAESVYTTNSIHSYDKKREKDE